MKCEKCGKEIPRSEKTCPYCEIDKQRKVVAILTVLSVFALIAMLIFMVPGLMCIGKETTICYDKKITASFVAFPLSLVFVALAMFAAFGRSRIQRKIYDLRIKKI